MHDTPELAIIIPIRNERDNLLVLIEKLQIAMTGIAWNVLFVDDGSLDGSVEIIREQILKNPRIGLLQRKDKRGLASACMDGFEQCNAPYLAVMDGDLQHDETLLPQMLDKLREGKHDLVVGVRQKKWHSEGYWRWLRVGLTVMGTWLVQHLFHLKLSDPLSGFFMMRREVYQEVSPRLYGKGYKILLDIILSSLQSPRIGEISYDFRQRHAGQSKLSLRVLGQCIMLLLHNKTNINLVEKSSQGRGNN